MPLLESWVIVLGTLLAAVSGVQAHSGRNVGGTPARTDEFPFMAALIDVFSIKPICGTTLVNARTVLTAANCFISSTNASKYLIFCGGLDYSRPHDSPNAKFSRVSRILIHPNYNSITLDYDVAMVNVLDSFVCTKHPCPGPVTLANPLSDPCWNGTIGIIAGWGTTSFGGPVSPVLLKTSVRVSTCESYGAAVTPRMLCAGAPDRDACHRDHGGPLVTYVNGHVVQCGIISWGVLCAGTHPSVYTAVSRVRPFIDLNSLL